MLVVLAILILTVALMVSHSKMKPTSSYTTLRFAIAGLQLTFQNEAY